MLQMDTEEKKYKLFRFFLSNEDNNKTEDENSIFIYTFILSIGHKRMLFFLLYILYLCIYIYIYHTYIFIDIANIFHTQSTLIIKSVIF